MAYGHELPYWALPKSPIVTVSNETPPTVHIFILCRTAPVSLYLSSKPELPVLASQWTAASVMPLFAIVVILEVEYVSSV